MGGGRRVALFYLILQVNTITASHVLCTMLCEEKPFIVVVVIRIRLKTVTKIIATLLVSCKSYYIQ